MQDPRPIRARQLPASLALLRELAYNLRWAWEPQTLDLFRRLDPETWRRSGSNPALMLLIVSDRALEEADVDPEFRDDVARAAEELRGYLNARGWYPRAHPDLRDLRVAYFTMEVGLTECLPLYSGGLGILAGDHLKSASALDLPIGGVSMLWQEGYFRQMLDASGWQVERYPNNEFAGLPIQVQRREDGAPLIVRAPLPGRDVEILVWRADVGRIPLYLLDTNLPSNSPADRGIAAQLYGGDQEMRLQQEIVLGIGGLRALDAMGLRPDVCHLNESHAAFVPLERIRLLQKETGLPFDVAFQATAAGNLFTTHTPVAAGFDAFPRDLMKRYMAEYAESLGLSFDSLMALGRRTGYPDEPFSMARLALRSSGACNGVSQLHGDVSRHLFWWDFERYPVPEVPISAVTNGIHTGSWISGEMTSLLNRYLERALLEEPDEAPWERVAKIPDGELWSAHSRGRARLVEFARERLQWQLAQRGAARDEIGEAAHALDPEALTIGFARRFATYKRPSLFLQDRERIMKLLLDSERPVQIVFAGKAHPRDEPGKEQIREIVAFTREPEVRGRIVFLEDYDMEVAAAMVQGVDVWMNNPRRPMEASGTSGMKVLPNGGLNLSVLDGWWAEAYSPEVGWAIGHGEEYSDVEAGDRIDAEALYARLENDVIPLFYRRDAGGLPRGWIAKMKASMAQLCYRFNTNRMVCEYAEGYYVPLAEHARALARHDFSRARALAGWKDRVRRAWGGVRIERAERQPMRGAIRHNVDVRLNGLSPDEVCVQVYSDPRGRGDTEQRVFTLQPAKAGKAGREAAEVLRFSGKVPEQGRPAHEYTVRVIPHHPDQGYSLDMPLITWENQT